MGGKASQSSTSCYTVGYRYYAGLHQVLCQGPIDAVLQLEVGDRLAWSGTQGHGSISVNAPYLFGGDDREGGVSGAVHIRMGSPSQAAEFYLADQVDRLVGVCFVELEARLTEAEDPAIKLTVTGELDGVAQTQDVDLSTPSWVPMWSAWDLISGMEIGAATVAADVELRRTDTDEVIGTIAQGDTELVMTWETSCAVGDMPAFRGVVGAIWESCYIASNNPYLKDVRWQAIRQTPQDGWYSAKAAVAGGGMNPAHILHELICSTVWGLGYPASDCDETPWRAAADTLYTENLGLNLVWSGESIEEFAQIVLDHIDGRLYVDPASGLWVLDLIRADYVVGNLPVLDAGNVLDVRSYERRGWDETVNEVVVAYIDSSTGKEVTVTAQNPANIAIQGAVVSVSRSYPGIGSPSLAGRIAQRDLQVLSRPLARASLVVNRVGWAWAPGQALRWQWPEYGIEEVVYRVAAIDTGTLGESAIGVELVEDVFGTPSASYIAEQPPEWTDPASEPLPCPHQAVIEAPYWDVVRSLSAADFAMLSEGAGFLLAMGERPNSVHYDYRIYSDAGSGYTSGRTGNFTPTAILVGAYAGSATVLTLASGIGLSEVVTGTWAQIGTELVAVLSLSGSTLTVDRGVLDTTPGALASGTRVWFGGSRRGQEGIERLDGEEIDVKLLTRTGLGPLPIASATAMSLTLDQRLERPYPPGNVTINTEAWPTTLSGDLTIAWAHRDRTQQTAYLVAQDEADIGPETGTTYRVRIYDSGTATLKRTWTGISGTSQVYAVADREADFGAYPHKVRVVIDAQRDGLDSWTTQIRDFTAIIIS